MALDGKMLFCDSDKRILKNDYIGDKITPKEILYEPIKIFYWEIIPSRYNPGKKLLVAQIAVYNKFTKTIEFRMLETEAFRLVKILSKEKEGIFYTKLIQNRLNYISPISLNKTESRPLENIQLPIENKNKGEVD